MTPHLNANGTILCGTTQAVKFQRGPGKIRWSRAPRVSCRMALALARFEEIVQEEARRLFDDRVYAARHVGTYNCREMAAYDGWVSEHSYANAIDLVSLTLARGTEISVRTHYFDPGPRGELLRDVARRAFEEDVFSVVLTPLTTITRSSASGHGALSHGRILRSADAGSACDVKGRPVPR